MNETERLAEGASALDLPPLPAPVLATLARYTNLLLRWNRKVNLLARATNAEAVLERHVLDSLALLRLVRPAGRVLDVGAGAGLPGIPLRVAVPEQELNLLEPSGKRAAFLRNAARFLELEGVTVRQARLGDLPPDDRYDLLLSRATFAPAEWLRRGAPLLAKGGRIVTMLGKDDPAEIVRAAEAVSLSLVARDDLRLPWSGAQRVNLVFARPD